ncbi:unnamed protein product [Clonostachys rosea]|uniref:F-box domain-containing protein n=1 Tax=Bionectria ochroleuca TaxID=29856 RepID=A0ABY6UBC4_BIOOC|nr:unnamed protein product [Clonostachys rosea]
MDKDKPARAGARRKRVEFSHVPTEIINNIMKRLRRPSLVDLCLVNKSLRSHAEPFLYSTVVFQWIGTRLPPIINLLQTLLRRPELLAFIRTVILKGSDSREIRLPNIRASESRIQHYMPIIQKLNLPLTDVWVQKLREGHMDAFVALLIAQASKMRRLIIVDNFLRSPDFIAQVLQCGALSQPPIWERLEQLVFFTPFVAQRPETALAPFYPSTVTQLVVSLGDMQLRGWPARELDLDRLTSLDINSSCTPLMAGLLARTRCLKSLSWEWEYSPGFAGIVVDLDKIIAAFSQVKATLESLRLRVDISQRWSANDEPELNVIFESMTPLIDFEKITKLDVPLLVLTGFGDEAESLVRSIPRNVEELSLSTGMMFQEVKWLPDLADEWPDEAILNTIEESFKNYRTSLPRLRCIEIIDTADCFVGKRIDEILEKTSPVEGIDIEIIRDIWSPWRACLSQRF